jgi:hypothetical protein
MLPEEGTPRQGVNVFNHSFRHIDHPITVKDPAVTQFPVFSRSTVPGRVNLKNLLDP